MAGAFENFMRPDQPQTAETAFEPITPQQQLLNYNTMTGRDEAWRQAEGSPWKSPEPGWLAKLMAHPGTQGLLNAANFIGPGPKASLKAGLSMDKGARIARAKEMGFDTDTVLYHGTTAPKFDRFELGHMRPGNTAKDDVGVFTTPDPQTASRYAGWDEIFPDPNMGSVLPLYARGNLGVHDFGGGKYGRPEAIAAAKAAGKDGVILKNHYDAGGVGDQYVIFDPKNLRSINADFDPAQTNSSNLMASRLAPTLGAGAAIGAFTRRDEEGY
jgi:hypothetical protein